MALQWTSLKGEVLAQSHAEHDWKGLLPNRSAVYMWRLRISPSKSEQANGSLLFEHLQRVTGVPFSVAPSKQISRTLKAVGFEIGGLGLGEKSDSVKELCHSAESRRLVVQLLESLELSCPPLYTGEADKLSDRIWQHMEGQNSTLLQDLHTWGLNVSHLFLQYLELKDIAPLDGENRTSTEHIVTEITLSGFTKRRG